MQEKTRKEIILDIIKELSENYSVNEATVIEQLCSSLSEVLSEQAPYKVETFFKDGELFFIGRTYQHGKEVDVALSVSKLKYDHFRKICLLLMKKLDILEYSQYYTKYGSMVNKVVFGRVKQILDEHVIVAIEGLDIPGKCCLNEMRVKTGKDLIDKRFAFHIINFYEEKLDKRLRFIFILSRNAKQTPAMLIKQLAKDEELVIKSVRRMPGKVSYLRSNKPVKMKILLKAEKELQGESIRIRRMSAGVSNDRT